MATVARRRGRYVVDYRDATGRRRWKSFKRKKDAEAHRDQVSQQTRQGIVVDERMTFDDLVTQFRSGHITTNVRESTRTDYEALLRLHLEPHFKGRKIQSINRQAVLDFRAELLDAGTGRRTVNKCLTLLGALFRFGQLNGHVVHNPTIRVKLPEHNEAEPDAGIDVLSLEQQRRLIDAAEGRWRVLILMALATGLRQGELLGLSWGDIDLAGGQIHVRRQNYRGRFSALKTRHARRSVPMPPELVSELKRWKLACPIGERDLVFPTSRGTPEHHSNMLRRGFLPALRRAGLRQIRFHDLRHCYVSTLIAGGVTNIKRIQTLVGHASAKITLDTYTHLLPDTDDGVAAAVGAALFESGSKVVAAAAEEGGEAPQMFDLIGGADGTRTRDPRRDRPVF